MFKILIKNGKYFVEPQKSSDNFKVLFARLAAEGAGRPVDKHGFPDGPWTPDTLADAISAIDANQNGIEVRAVQVWFQDNDNGISNDNIRWLSRVFGCDDPAATSQWQAELTAAKERLASERREKRKSALNSAELTKIHNNEPDITNRPVTVPGDTPKSYVERFTASRSRPSVKTLSEKCEWILSGSASMNLLITYWLVFCGLGLLNYVLGTHSVTYSPADGLTKQVGFIWAPTLTILPIMVLPLFIFFVSDLNTYWKRAGRFKCTSEDVTTIDRYGHAAWHAKVNDYSFAFWSIALFCFLFVFGFQWAGIYLPAYLSGDANGVQIDRYLVTLVRPDLISIPEAMVLSAVGYLYTASYIAIFMFGLLFLVILVVDYQDICTTSALEGSISDRPQLRREGQKIVWGSFRVAVFALWLATLIKLQITYLSSDSKDFLTWLKTDALSVFDATETRNGWLENSSISHFTTFLMMVVTVTIFIVCLVKIRVIFDRLSLYDGEYTFAHDQKAVIKMLLIITLLSLNLVLIGRFTGFSLLLAVSAMASMHVLSGPKLRIF